MCIEGLLPDKIHRAVYSAHPEVVQAGLGGDKSAKNKLKRLYLEEFRRTAKPGEDYTEFYRIGRLIDKALC
jgi:hypothetical protein